MDFPSLLQNLERKLKILQNRRVRYLNIESLPKEQLQELTEGLKLVVPHNPSHEKLPEKKILPSEWLQQQLIKQKTEQNAVKPRFNGPSASIPLVSSSSINPYVVQNSGNRSAGLENMENLPQREVTSVPEANNLEELHKINRDCMRCPLGRTRTKLVFGRGTSQTPLIFIGEGPGADEDAQGEPFVGRAGKLLTKMLHSIGIDRQDVYITNVVKCRPPGNRNPEPLEVASCRGILDKQLELVAPKLIVTLGNVPTRALFPDIQGITKVRGKPLKFRDWTLLPTFHPSYLLRNRTAMSFAWKDFKTIASIAFSES